MVHLGRPGAMGDLRRVASWRAILSTAGYRVTDVRLLPGRRVGPSDLGNVMTTALRVRPLMPEALAWSSGSVRRDLARLAPDLTVFVGARALSAGPGPELWFGRVGLRGPVERQLFRSRSAERDRTKACALLESVEDGESLRGRAAACRASGRGRMVGRRGAVGRLASQCCNGGRRHAARRSPDVDVLFIGTLSYPPNVDALRRLSHIWGHVQLRRPGTTLLVAGAHPSREVRGLAAADGWELAADFPDEDAIFARARIAVAPLRFASGIQNKVLDAAAHGLAQVVDPVALSGLGPGFPVIRAVDDRQFATRMVDLLGDPDLAATLGREGARFVEKSFSVSGWAQWVIQHLAAPIDRVQTRE